MRNKSRPTREERLAFCRENPGAIRHWSSIELLDALADRPGLVLNKHMMRDAKDELRKRGVSSREDFDRDCAEYQDSIRRRVALQREKWK